MELIGWIATVLVALWVSAMWLLFLFNGEWQYNIGGAHNSTLQRVSIVIGVIIPIGVWSLVVEYAPFTLTVN